jgi:hypothetical protein
LEANRNKVEYCLITGMIIHKSSVWDFKRALTAFYFIFVFASMNVMLTQAAEPTGSIQ